MLQPSTSGSDTPSVTSKRHELKKFSKIPLRYPRISKRTPLLSVPLGKPPVFAVKIIVCVKGKCALGPFLVYFGD
jgi:hypothetical protein